MSAMFEFIIRHLFWLLLLWVICSVALIATRELGFVHWPWMVILTMVLLPLVPVVLMVLVAMLWRP